MKIISPLSLLVMTLGFSACSLFSPASTPEMLPIAAPELREVSLTLPLGRGGSKSSAQRSAGPGVPFELEIAQSFVDAAGNLNVKLYLTPLSALEPKNLLLSLVGLSEGEVLGEKQRLLSDFTEEPKLVPGKRVVALLELPAEGLREYQVRCSWGEDAQKLASSPNSSEKAVRQEATAPALPSQSSYQHSDAALQEIAPLLLQDFNYEIEEPPCKKTPCERFFTLFATLRNNAPQTLLEVNLAAGFVWLNEGEKFPPVLDNSPLREGEEVIQLRNLNLRSGALKALRIAVDRPVPELEGGRYEPYLRILGDARQVLQIK